MPEEKADCCEKKWIIDKDLGEKVTATVNEAGTFFTMVYIFKKCDHNG